MPLPISSSKTSERGVALCERLEVGRGMLWFARALDVHRAEIDSLNVYPVPDGDTGTNLSLTQRAVVLGGHLWRYGLGVRGRRGTPDRGPGRSGRGGCAMDVRLAAWGS